MHIWPRLLDHPFYTAWTRGDIPLSVLAGYHQAYGEFVRHLPSLWKTVVTAFRPGDPLGTSVIAEETDHVRLWQLWGKALTPPENTPSLTPLVVELQRMSPSTLLGSLQAFEVQQPEVARTKREGLVTHYGFDPATLAYFDEHEKEEEHIRYGRQLARVNADPGEFDEGMRRGAALFYRSLDVFVDQDPPTDRRHPS